MRGLVLAAAAVAALAVAPAASAASSYCSPSCDYCTSTQRVGGAVMLRLTTFSFSEPVRICVTGPNGRRVCKTFRPAKRGATWQVNVRWHRHFPNAGRGRYRVGFFLGRTRLGPVLDFRLR